jgi:hypothetical protein
LIQKGEHERAGEEETEEMEEVVGRVICYARLRASEAQLTRGVRVPPVSSEKCVSSPKRTGDEAFCGKWVRFKLPLGEFKLSCGMANASNQIDVFMAVIVANVWPTSAEQALRFVYFDSLVHVRPWTKNDENERRLIVELDLSNGNESVTFPVHRTDSLLDNARARQCESRLDRTVTG